MSYDIDKINGPNSFEALKVAREKNAAKMAGPAAVHEALMKLGGDFGVVSPNNSREIHSGEVPVVEKQLPPVAQQ